MEIVTSVRALGATDLRSRMDPAVAGLWVLAFVLPLYLALKGGGYDAVVRGQVGLAVWWAVLVGCAVGILPLTRPGRAGWAVIGILTAFAAWSVLSATWSSSSERSVLEGARVATHLGVLVVAASTVRRGTGRYVISALAAAVGVIGVLALLSRVHPAWFPASETADFLPSSASRLSYPLNYWNALGAFMAVGIPLLLAVAASAHFYLTRALAAAAVPICFAALYLTYSRGAFLALAVGLVLLVVTWPRRTGMFAGYVLAALGSGILGLASHQRSSLANAYTDLTAVDQGNQVIWIAIAVALGCGLLQVAIALVDRHVTRPRWTQITPRRLTSVAVGALVIAIVVAIAAGGIHRASDEWQSFKQLDTTVMGAEGSTAGRLTATSGNGRYQYWQSAAEAADEYPIEGVGAGTFEYWWSQHAAIEGVIRHAHSRWMETLAELGYVGLALIAALFIVPLMVGLRRMPGQDLAERQAASAAAAGIVAFCVSATLDWVWQVTVLPVAALLLIAVLIAPARGASDASVVRRRGPRAILGIMSVLAIVLIAVPLAGVTSVRASQVDAQQKDLAAALQQARRAQQVQPYAATPLLQEALLYEQAGDLNAAANAATRATDAESQNWRTWIVLSRIEAERGRASSAVEAYRTARRLNPKSVIFTR
jgi:hypothetical protein